MERRLSVPGDGRRYVYEASLNHMAESSDVDLIPRTAAEIARRTLALIAIVDHAHNENPEALKDWVTSNSIADEFSDAEREFFDKANPTTQDITTFSWRAEAMVPLLWSVWRLPELPPLNVQIDWSQIDDLNEILTRPGEFVSSAELRPIEEINEAEAFLYHQHWRVRDAQLFQKPMPEELDPGIVFERRYAASWIVGWGRAAGWDNVPTDT